MFIKICRYPQRDGLLDNTVERETRPHYGGGWALAWDAHTFLIDHGFDYKLFWNRCGRHSHPGWENVCYWEIEIDDDVAEHHMDDLVLFRLKFTRP